MQELRILNIVNVLPNGAEVTAYTEFVSAL